MSNSDCPGLFACRPLSWITVGQHETEEALALVRDGLLIAHDSVARGRFEDAVAVLEVISQLLRKAGVQAAATAA
jgi:hypothetical protein